MTIPNIAFCICISNCNCIIQYGINTSIKKPKERAANSINFFQNPFIPFRLDITCPVALSAIIPVTQSKTIAHATEDMINPYCFVNDRQIPAFLRCSMNFSLHCYTGSTSNSRPISTISPLDNIFLTAALPFS